MGILNVTPDSFHDGGVYAGVEAAVERGLLLVAEGAGIIDVGGESTRPGARRVEVQEQIDRTLPVIENLRAASDCTISIDTTRAVVADAALAAGANVINDVSAGMEDPAILDVAAGHGSGLILMHRLLPPEQDTYSNQYPADPDYGETGVLEAVRGFLLERVGVACDRGVARERIAVDPGLGFGKSVSQNMLLLGGLVRFLEDGLPLVVGASRKSFLGAITGSAATEDRLPASLAAAVISATQGAQVIRAHDVRETVEALSILTAAGHPTA